MSQSKGVITSCQQLVYITQWFTEMSEMQTQDFMKYLLNKYAKSGHQSDNQLINGFNHLDMSERPASIFQCRMKLFSEWFLQWSDEEKQELLIRLRNIDSKFMDEFQSNVESNNTTGALTDDYQSHTLNGNIDDDSKSSEQLVMNGVNSDQIQEPIDLKPVVEEEQEEEKEEVVSPQEEEQPVEQAVDLVVAQEVEVVVNGGDEEEECLMKAADELIVNNNESSNELQEVCG